MNDAKVRPGATFRNKCSTCGQPRRGHICPGVNSAAAAAYKLAALREPKLPKPAAPPPPPPPAPPPRAWPLPPGEPARAPNRLSPAFGEEDNAQEEGEETDGEESFHALLALFTVGPHVEPALLHHMHASIATTAALGFAEPSPEASAEQANRSVDITAAATTIDAAATPGVTQVVELVDEPEMLPGWSAWLHVLANGRRYKTYTGPGERTVKSRAAMCRSDLATATATSTSAATTSAAAADGNASSYRRRWSPDRRHHSALPTPPPCTVG